MSELAVCLQFYVSAVIEKETLMPELQKCAHPACKCLVSKDSQYGKYCSDHCREAEDKIEIRCDCQHAECR